ncbi:MAG: C25 family cysteine peptidase, partial [Candidatus Eisenbacteria bacterium]
LAAWRTARLPLEAHGPPYHATRVPVSAVYDQFSGGRTDPGAIRSFLRAAFFNWRAGGHAAPTYVTLLGDASFDYRNLLGLANPGLPGCLLPSFENNIVGSPGVQYATDDWMLNIDDLANTAIPDFFGGRITSGDAVSSVDYVHRKLFFYERSAPTGADRNRVMFIADDDQQGFQDDPLKWAHLQQTATLDSLYTPDHVDRTYVYLHTYPDGPGRTKPGAKADIKNTINGDGVVMFNYIGHGSPFKLSDENVLIDVDAGTFTNAARLPLFVAASCDVGKFNDPRVQSLGERLLLATAGGTIGVVSATELAYSQFNVNLNNDLYDEIFRRAPGSGEFERSVSHALLAAKLLNSTGSFEIQNNQKYQLLGDAALRLNLPRRWVEVELLDAAGTGVVSEIRGGQTITFRGRVVDRPGGVPVPYSGVADLLIEDSQPRLTSPPCAFAPNCQKAIYDFRAGPIFRGDVLIAGGAFTGKFVVPLESVNGPRGKVRAYVAGLPSAPPQIDGVGSIRMQVSPGSAPSGDDQGPIISLSFAGGVTSVKPDATLRIELTDPSGILTTGHTIQNGIVVTLDGNTTARVDVTSSFRYAAGSFTSGAATFVLPNLAPGTHTIKVSAADNLAAGLTAFNHRSSAEITFEVVSTPPITIRNAYLFPNPTESGRRSSGGQFVIDGPGDSVNVLVRLYTISGRMIRELKSFGDFGQVQIGWDGLDAEGYPLANGTYLFKVYVNGRDDQGRSTSRQKASREGRFVILNH